VMDLPREAYAEATSPMESHINVGCGTDISIADLARLIARIVGFEGTIDCDASKPDGTPRKLLDVSRLARLHWEARISLEEGIRATYHGDFLKTAAGLTQ